MSTTVATTQTKLSTEVPQKCSSTPADGQKARLRHIPRPTDKHEERRWQLEHMAGAFRVFAKFGYCDGSSGHISVRDPVEPDTFWINPYSIHFGMVKVGSLAILCRSKDSSGGLG